MALGEQPSSSSTSRIFTCLAGGPVHGTPHRTEGALPLSDQWRGGDCNMFMDVYGCWEFHQNWGEFMRILREKIKNQL